MRCLAFLDTPRGMVGKAILCVIGGALLLGIPEVYPDLMPPAWSLTGRVVAALLSACGVVFYMGRALALAQSEDQRHVQCSAVQSAVAKWKVDCSKSENAFAEQVGTISQDHVDRDLYNCSSRASAVGSALLKHARHQRDLWIMNVQPEIDSLVSAVHTSNLKAFDSALHEKVEEARTLVRDRLCKLREETRASLDSSSLPGQDWAAQLDDQLGRPPNAKLFDF